MTLCRRLSFKVPWRVVHDDVTRGGTGLRRRRTGLGGPVQDLLTIVQRQEGVAGFLSPATSSHNAFQTTGTTQETTDFIIIIIVVVQSSSLSSNHHHHHYSCCYIISNRLQNLQATLSINETPFTHKSKGYRATLGQK